MIGRIHIELTSRCNKECYMCGRRKLELKDLGDMPLELLKKVIDQIPPYTVVQFHWNGEPLLYPHLARAISWAKERKLITGLDTNGKLLMDQASAIIGQLDTLTLSVFENDEEGQEQKEIAKAFLKLKQDKPPQMVYRLLGRGIDKREWRHFPGLKATRVLHDPEMSRNYEKPVTIPEMGICLDLLHSVAIDRYGHVNHCVRLDPDGLGRIGDANSASLLEIVNGIQIHSWHKHPRRQYIDLHRKGRRDEVPLCAGCDFYGVPTGWT